MDKHVEAILSLEKIIEENLQDHNESLARIEYLKRIPCPMAKRDIQHLEARLLDLRFQYKRLKALEWL